MGISKRFKWRILITSIALLLNLIVLVIQENFSWWRLAKLPVNLFLGWVVGLQIDKYLHSKRELDSTKSVLVDYTYALDSSVDAIGITNEEGNHEFVNEELARLYGYQKDELLTIHWEKLFTQESIDYFHENFFSEVKKNGYDRSEATGLKSDGSTFPLEITMSLLNETQKTLVIIRDITKKKQYEAMVKYKAEHNELTHLPNRRKLNQDLEIFKEQSLESSLLFIDLDRFKITNDTMGREVGDKLLIEVAERLNFFSNRMIKTYHLGGDEFVVLILKENMDFVKNIAMDIGEYIKEPFYLKGNEIFVTASIGISGSPEHTDDMNELITMADTAMYYAKLDGKNTYKFFNNELKEQRERRTLIEIELRRAIRNEELYVVYQPKFDLHNSKLAGIEALIRWDNPVLGMVSPMEFIPVAEDTGLINEIGNWIINDVLYQMRRWQDKGYSPVKVSVNVSQRQFRDNNFVPFIESCLYSYSIEAKYLEFEVTESVIENIDLVMPKINSLKALGVGISIDDFGTGYSSLSMLKNLPFDTLKIDQSFIRDLIGNSQDLSLVKTIISIGQTFNLNVVAEGIEKEEHLHLLAELDCPMGQGYFFSKPIRPEQLEVEFFKLIGD
ncbi:diguanylate cyclase (GGDEF) domain-containing protein [Paenisporosarcina sp. HGH0030]|uniref:sensor domain-containing protein n=1 Tax=Paenisporosarcina sp. HGH0030 TaxID=1078085 RepID=UPI00034E8965|nr:bifunctional diguanylate cyclase/phosphodiesterase [Paenisporosarcina sp. HGH0030]EPD52311.1 diguanylate cyclase (GGDEF) domain-containing protein [Paenisporosarcina sp. HGH0030]